MKLNYYEETDSLYIDLNSKPGVETREIAPGVLVDMDEEGHVVGIDIDHASKVMDLNRLDVLHLPLARIHAA